MASVSGWQLDRVSPAGGSVAGTIVITLYGAGLDLLSQVIYRPKYLNEAAARAVADGGAGRLPVRRPRRRRARDVHHRARQGDRLRRDRGRRAAARVPLGAAARRAAAVHRPELGGMDVQLTTCCTTPSAAASPRSPSGTSARRRRTTRSTSRRSPATASAGRAPPRWRAAAGCARRSSTASTSPSTRSAPCATSRPPRSRASCPRRSPDTSAASRCVPPAPLPPLPPSHHSPPPAAHTRRAHALLLQIQLALDGQLFVRPGANNARRPRIHFHLFRQRMYSLPPPSHLLPLTISYHSPPYRYSRTPAGPARRRHARRIRGEGLNGYGADRQDQQRAHRHEHGRARREVGLVLPRVARARAGPVARQRGQHVGALVEVGRPPLAQAQRALPLRRRRLAARN